MEGGLQVSVEPFNQTLGLWVTRLADDHVRAQYPAECLELITEFDLACPVDISVGFGQVSRALVWDGESALSSRRRKPKIAIYQLTRPVPCPRRWITRIEQCPQHRHPLCEHRRRHLRELRQQLPDPKLELVHRRPLLLPLVPRRLIRDYHPSHRVL